MTLLELAETVIRVTDSRSEIVFAALPMDDPQVRQPDITRARQVLRWQPEVGLEDGLRRTVRSLLGGSTALPDALPAVGR
jgi:dTDP-glucose 4,6-dehydratase